MKTLRTIFLAVSAVFLLNTCTKDEPGGNTGTESSVYDVTLSDRTVYVDSVLAQSLVRLDTADQVYYFSGDDSRITGLKADDILLIHGVALRKVASVSRSGGETVVETDPATLNEAIRDGVISWDKEINFGKGVVPVVQMKGREIKAVRSGTDGFDFEFTYGSYSYHIKFDFSDTKADVLFEISKDLVKPVTAKFTAKGSIENFHSNTEMEFQGGELTRFGQKNANMKGDLTLNLTVAGSGRDGVTFDFPVVLLKYPVMVGPIPVVINVKVLFVINCVVPVDGSSQVEVKFSYNSTTGIKYDGTQVSADASMGDQSMDKNIAQTGASSAIGVNWGLAFPRLEIGVFDQVIVPWIQTAFLIGGDYTFMPACQQARSQFIGACGIDLSFLGFGYSASKTLWQQEKVLMKVGDCN